MGHRSSMQASHAKVADLVEQRGTNLWFEQDDAWWVEQLELPAGTTRRNDTLDVWIDSGVSHQAVLRHHPDQHFPADVYIEATDQHRGWFQSSLMTSVALNGVAPYKTVITHGFVVDKDTKKKISKSEQGGYKKPMEADYFVNKYGAGYRAPLGREHAIHLTTFLSARRTSPGSARAIAAFATSCGSFSRTCTTSIPDNLPPPALPGQRQSIAGCCRNCKASSRNAGPHTRRTIFAKSSKR
jgi:hypothetical protein